jgi:sulfur carrier protein
MPSAAGTRNATPSKAPESMQIQLNGTTHTLDDAPTVAELLERTGYAGRRVAVEINQAIVPRSAHATHRVAEGDRIEVVTAFGGG